MGILRLWVTNVLLCLLLGVLWWAESPAIKMKTVYDPHWYVDRTQSSFLTVDMSHFEDLKPNRGFVVSRSEKLVPTKHNVCNGHKN